MAFFSHPITFSAIYTLCFFPLFVFHISPFRKVVSKQDLSRVLITVGFLALLMFAASAWLFYYIPEEHFQLLFKTDLLVYYLASFLAPVLTLRRRVREMLFVAGVVGIFALMGISISLFIARYLPLTGLIQLEVICAITFVCAIPAYPLMQSTFSKTVTPFLDSPDSSYWRNIWIIPFVMMAAVVLPVPFKDFLNTPSQLISRLLIGVATVFMCRSIAYDFTLLSHRMVLEGQLESQREYYKTLSEKIDIDRRARHDFQHHLTALSSLAEHGTPDDLKAYCRQLHAELGGDMPMYTGNGAVDGVIHRYTRLCKEAAVPFEVFGHLPSHSSLELDLCVALGNALENALTANSVLPVENRFIDVSIRSENTLLTIIVKNSFDGVVLTDDTAILSRKRRHEAGYGLESIRSVCEAHSGTVSIRYDDTCFSIMMLWDLKI